MGLLNDILGVFTDPTVADTLTGAAKGALSSRQADDALKLGKGGLQLNRDKFATNAPAKRLNTGLRASLAANATPASVQWGGRGSGMPVFSGGVKSIGAALADPTAHALSNQVLNDSLLAQMKGGQGGDSSLGDASNVGNPGLLEQILGGAGLGSSLLSALKKALGGGGGGTGGGGKGSTTPPTNGNTGARTGDFGDWLDPDAPDPNNGNTGARTGDFGDWLDPDAPDPNTSGVAYGPGGEPLPHGGGDDGDGYYDESGNYVPPYGGGYSDPYGTDGGDYGDPP